MTNTSIESGDIGKSNLIFDAGGELLSDITSTTEQRIGFRRKINLSLGNVLFRDRRILPSLQKAKRRLVIKPVEDGVIVFTEQNVLLVDYLEVYEDVQSLLSGTKDWVTVSDEEGELYDVNKESMGALQEIASTLWREMDQQQRINASNQGYNIRNMNQVFWQTA